MTPDYYSMNKITLVLATSLFVSTSISAFGANLNNFFNALAKVESSQNPKAINRKENALGLYQIRPGYFADSKVSGKHSDTFNPAVARKVCESYFKRYAPEAYAKGDFETLARLHNMGPGYKRNLSATNKYWSKIQKNLK